MLKVQHQFHDPIQIHFFKTKFKAQFMEDLRIIYKIRDISSLKISNGGKKSR